MRQAAERFAEYFQAWGLRLPDDHVISRTDGVLQEGGWTVHYTFGEEDGREFVQFYAMHRMTNDRNVRIHADGRLEHRPAP
jgi:hypothetical protein